MSEWLFVTPATTIMVLLSKAPDYYGNQFQLSLLYKKKQHLKLTWTLWQFYQISMQQFLDLATFCIYFACFRDTFAFGMANRMTHPPVI